MPAKYTSYELFDTEKSKCRICQIGKIYNQVVLSDGCRVNPKVLVVGEAPGREELVSDPPMPFVGKAGKLLRKTLNEFGFRKHNSLITNVMPCRPQDNKFPSDEHVVEFCVRHWLLEEIWLTKPSYILLVGATPLLYLLKQRGITKLRGKFQPLSSAWPRSFDDFTTLCMPTFHPSFVNRKMYVPEEGTIIVDQFREDIRTVAVKAGFIGDTQ